MHITSEQVREAIEKPEPDLKTCVHYWSSVVVDLSEVSESDRFGVIARVVGHDREGNLMTHDLLMSGPALAQIGTDIRANVLDIIGRVQRPAHHMDPETFAALGELETRLSEANTEDEILNVLNELADRIAHAGKDNGHGDDTGAKSP